MIVSRHKLLQFLAIDKDVFDRLRRAGAPIRPDKKVHVGDFVAFMIDDAIKRSRGSLDPNFGFNYEVAKGKEKSMKADLREMEMKELAGRLVDAADARAVARELLKIVRDRLISIRIAGLGPEQEQLLIAALADATDGLAAEKAETIGQPAMELRH